MSAEAVPFNDGTSDPMDLAPDWARHMHAETVATHATLDAILERVDSIVDDVKPTIEKLSTSPIFKMLGGR